MKVSDEKTLTQINIANGTGNSQDQKMCLRLRS